MTYLSEQKSPHDAEGLGAPETSSAARAHEGGRILPLLAAVLVALLFAVVLAGIMVFMQPPAPVGEPVVIAPAPQRAAAPSPLRPPTPSPSPAPQPSAPSPLPPQPPQSERFMATIRTAQGPAWMQPGVLCTMDLQRLRGGRFGCRAVVDCIGHTLYGAGDSGFFPCQETAGYLAGSDDVAETDGDAAFTLSDHRIRLEGRVEGQPYQLEASFIP